MADQECVPSTYNLDNREDFTIQFTITIGTGWCLCHHRRGSDQVFLSAFLMTILFTDQSQSCQSDHNHICSYSFVSEATFASELSSQRF